MPVTFDNTTICTIDNIKQRVKSLPFVARDTPAMNALYTQKIELVKSWIKRDLRIWLRRTYPKTVDTWITTSLGLYSQVITQLKAQYAQTNTNTIVQINGTDLVPFGVLDQWQGSITKPRTFFKSGAPTAGEYAGTAKNGDYVVDVSGRRLYINRSTSDATVDWQAFSTDSLIDLILDYSPLQTPCETGVIWQCMVDGALELRAGNSPSEIMEKVIPDWKTMYEEDLEKAKELLDVDVSGDGLISSYEASANERGNLIW